MLISGRGQKNLLQDRDVIFLFFFKWKTKNKITKQNATDNVLFVILIGCVEV